MLFRVLQVIGGLIIIIGYMPQLRQLFKSRSAADLNLNTYLMITFGVACVEAYAFNMVFNYGVGRLFLISNSATLFMLVVTSLFIVGYKRRPGGPLLARRPRSRVRNVGT